MQSEEKHGFYGISCVKDAVKTRAICTNLLRWRCRHWCWNLYSCCRDGCGGGVCRSGGNGDRSRAWNASYHHSSSVGGGRIASVEFVLRTGEEANEHGAKKQEQQYEHEQNLGEGRQRLMYS